MFSIPEGSTVSVSYTHLYNFLPQHYEYLSRLPHKTAYTEHKIKTDSNEKIFCVLKSQNLHFMKHLKKIPHTYFFTNICIYTSLTVCFIHLTLNGKKLRK